MYLVALRPALFPAKYIRPRFGTCSPESFFLLVCVSEGRWTVFVHSKMHTTVRNLFARWSLEGECGGGLLGQALSSNFGLECSRCSFTLHSSRPTGHSVDFEQCVLTKLSAAMPVVSRHAMPFPKSTSPVEQLTPHCTETLSPSDLPVLTVKVSAERTREPDFFRCFQRSGSESQGAARTNQSAPAPPAPTQWRRAEVPTSKVGTSLLCFLTCSVM